MLYFGGLAEICQAVFYIKFSSLRGDGMKYALAYNEFHNLESIGIEGKAEKLIQYTYKNGNGRLKEMKYANGDTMKATYNSIGQMIAEKWFDSTENLTAHYKYVYDGDGNIVRSIDILANREYNYEYEEGKIVRATEADIELNEEIVTSKVIINTVKYYYDTEGKMTKKVLTFSDNSTHTVHYENSDDNTVVKFSAGGRTVTNHSKTDSFGRKVFDELQLGTDFVSRQFVYHAGKVTAEHKENAKVKSSATTQLVSQIILSNGTTLSYGYDAEERITSVSEKYIKDGIETTHTVNYTYDALGQLLTETSIVQTIDRSREEPIVETSTELVNSMEYDNYGNITKKNGKTYTYGDAKWKDLLTGFDGKTIEYDAQGNPTSYLGHTLTWEKGRQLKSFDGITYTYNANGIRTSKTVDGVKHTYTLDGAKILRETWGGNALVPLYDNEDSVCGILYNNIPYYFIKNLQGDVIAIVDKDAKTVAEYSYDAWGVVTNAVTDTELTNGVDIATINPFRYRGYYYDEEIKFYYLQTRYYSPSIGRFINEDESVYIAISASILGYNLFTYCENDAPNLSDPTGHYAGALVLSKPILASLGSALPGIMTGISASLASVKAAIATSWFIPVCIAAAAIAIVGIVYVVNRVIALMASATQTVSAVKSKARSKGIDPNKLRNYTVYVIVKNGTIDVVYVGITKRYSSRKSQHKNRFPTSKFTMMPIATGLTKNEARAMEQTIITAYTLDTLVNMINSISPKKWSTFKSEFEQMSTLMQSWIDQE